MAYADENILNDEGKVEYTKLNPVLFEMPTYSYLRTGGIVAKCATLGGKYRESINDNKQ